MIDLAQSSGQLDHDPATPLWCPKYYQVHTGMGPCMVTIATTHFVCASDITINISNVEVCGQLPDVCVHMMVNVALIWFCTLHILENARIHTHKHID